MANVGTAKVEIKADFGSFESDMKSFFAGAGKTAGDAVDSATSKGVDSAKKSVKSLGSDVKDEAGKVDVALGDAGAKGGAKLADNVSKAADGASKSLEGVADAAGEAGEGAAQQFSVNIEGVSDAAANASTGAAKALSTVAEAGSDAGAGASSGFARNVDGMTDAAGGAATGVSRVFGSITSLGGSVGSGISSGFSTAINGMSSAAGEVASAVSRNFASMQDSANEAIDRISGVVRGAATAAGAMLGLAGAGTVMNNAFAKLTSIEDTTASLGILMGSADDAAKVMSELAETNQQTPYAFDAWAGAGKTLIAFGQDASETAATVTALGEAASASGKGQEALENMADAFGQALSTGKVSMQTLNRLSQGGVNGLAILGNEAGKTTEEMAKLVSKGAVPAEDAIRVLSKGIMEGSDGINGSTVAMQGTMKAMAETTSGVLTNLGAAFTNLGGSLLSFIFPAIKVVGQALTDLTYAFKGVIDNLAEGEGVWGAIRVAIIGVSSAIFVFLLPAIAAFASAVASRLGGGLFLEAIGSAKNFWFAAAGKGGEAAGVLTTIGEIGKRWAIAAGEAVAQGARAAGAWVKALPGNATTLLKTIVDVGVEWAKSAATAVVEGARAAKAWALAAPAKAAETVKMIAGLPKAWATAAAESLTSAAVAGKAWLVAAPGKAAALLHSIALVGRRWLAAGAQALIGAGQAALAWAIAFAPIAIVIGAIAGIVALFVTLWNRVDAFREFWQNVWDVVSTAAQTAWDFIVNIVSSAWDAIVGVFTGDGVGNLWGNIVDVTSTVWETMKGVVGGVAQFFGDVFTGIADNVSTAWNVIYDVFMWVWDNALSPIYEFISSTWGKLAELLSPVWDEVSEKVASFGEWFSGFWGETIWPALSKIIDFFKMIGEAIGNFISNHWEVLKPILIVLGTVLLTPIIVGLGLVVGAIAAVVAIVGLVVAAITGFVYLLVKLPGWVAGVVTAIGNWFANMWNKAREVWDNMKSAVSDWVNNHIRPLPGQVGEALVSVINWFKALPGRLWEAFKGAGTWLVNAGKDIVSGLLNGIGDGAARIGDWFLDKVPGWIKTPFKKALGIASPSKVFAEYGRNIGEGLVEGVDSMRSSVASSTQSLASSAAAVTVDSPQVSASRVDLSGADVAGSLDGESFANMSSTLTSTADSSLTPMWQQQRDEMSLWGTVMNTQAHAVVIPAMNDTAANVALNTSSVINPSIRSMGDTTAFMTAAQFMPSMLAMRTDMDTTGFNARMNANNVINPSVRSIGDTSWQVLHNAVNPALAGMRGAVAHTAHSFAQGASNIAVQWSRVREATAAPVRFTIQRVFNDGIVGMWNSVSDLLGTKKMGAYPVRFNRGGKVPGAGRGDKVPAYLEPGEFVLRRTAVRHIGVDNLQMMNNPAALRNRGGTHAAMTSRGPTMFMSGGGVVPSMISIVKKKYPQMVVTSTLRPGSADLHGQGLAADFAWPGAFGNHPMQLSLARDIARTYPGSMELIYDSPGWAGNIKNGRRVGAFGQYYTMAQAGPHHHHVHWAMNVPPTIPLGGGVFRGGSAGGGALDFGSILAAEMNPKRDKMMSAAKAYASNNRGLISSLPVAVGEKLSKAVEHKTSKLAAEIMSDPGGAGVARWEPMVRRALAWVGFPVTDRNVRLMLSQIASESGGDPNITQHGYVDANTGGNEAVGLLQIAKGTWPSVRDPRLPDDRRHPFANMVGALRYYKGKYGMDLGLMWGKGHGYDLGGLLTETGLFSKQTTKAERVLSPRQTQAFDELVGFLDSTTFDRLVSGRTIDNSVSSSSSSRRVEVSQHFHGNVMSPDEVAAKTEDRLLGSSW